MSVLVIAETREGAVTALTLELLGLARSLVETHPHPEGQGTVCLLFSDNADAARTLIAHGADRVYACARDAEDYESEPWLIAAAKLAGELRPTLVLAGHTAAGADLAPRLAFRLGAGVATGCVAVAANGERIACTRACFGVNARETISFARGAAIATVRPGVGSARDDASREGEIVKLDAPAPGTRVRVVHREREPASGMRLEDAKIVVAGGRGLEGLEGFAVIEALAGVLGAAVGASRVPCDLGWVPHSKQIGLTGKTVTPDLYFAVGISGAGHHLAGCGNARAIVAINTDPDAAIFREAKFGIVGDYRKIVPALTQALAELKS
jgi:electron transfer flavoprotein alpha subunit